MSSSQKPEMLLEERQALQRLQEVSIFERLESAFADFDDKDVGILIKFYLTGRAFPMDTQPYCFPILSKELRDMGFKMGDSAIRKRMKVLVGFDLLARDRIGKNTTSYYPLREESAIGMIRKYIQKWCAKRGLNQVFKISDNNK